VPRLPEGGVVSDYEEWQDARRRVVTTLLHPVDESLEPLARAVTEAVLGPCPPEPAPKDWYAGVLFLSAVKIGGRRSVVIYCDDPARRNPHTLTPDEAFAMSEALMQHARYARETLT
jgi:hypothetical protein